MEENRNNGMPNPVGMNPNPMGGMPNMGMPGVPGGMNQNMGGMPGMPGMPPMGGMPGMPGMPPMGGMNRPPMPPQSGAPVGGASTALVPVGSHAPEVDKTKKKKKKPNAAASFFAVLLFLLMAGGLFMGMLGQYWAYLNPSSLYLPSIVEKTTLKGSLVGIAIDAAMNINGYLGFDFSRGVLVGIMRALKNILPAFTLVVLAICVIYSLLATLIALFSRMNGKRALQITSTCMLVGYGGCGFSTLLFGETDFGCLALAAVGLVVAFFATMATNKGIGVLNAIVTVLSLAATELFAFPSSELRRYALESAEQTPLIVGFVALGVLYLNLLFTSARICAKKGKVFDFILHFLQFAVLVTVFVMALISKDPVYNLFGMLMPIVCAVGAPALAFVMVIFSFIMMFVPKIMRKKEERKAKKAGKVVADKSKDKKEKATEVVGGRPAALPQGMPNGAPAMQGQPAVPPMPQMPLQPGQKQPKQPKNVPPMPPMPQMPPQQAQPQQPARPMLPPQQQRPPMRQPAYREPAMDDEFSRSATSFKVPFSTGSIAPNGKPDSAMQEAIERLTAEMRAMKEAQSTKTSIEITPQEDLNTKAALEMLAEQLRAMKEAQKQAPVQSDPETKSALEMLAAELRAMKETQARMEDERKSAEDNRLEDERKAQDNVRIAEADRIAQAAKAEAERIAKEAERKADEMRLEAARQTEEERKKLEEERRALEEARKAAEEARLDAERKAAEARAEAERRAEEARLEIERKEAERKAEAERRALEEARLEAERQAQEAREEAERVQKEAERRAAEAQAEAARRAAEAQAEAERRLAEERKALEEARLEMQRKAEEERRAIEEARLEEERKRKEEFEQLRQEMLNIKNQPAPQPEQPKDGNMDKIMEELRSLREAQAQAQGNTTVNYTQDDSEQLKRMEELIRSQQKEPPKREPTAFEKRMAELAAKKSGASAAAAVASSTPVRPTAPTPAPSPMPSAAAEPLRYDTSKHDPFIATLTPNEVNEFGDIFISNKLGVLEYMPGYVIGGDNKAFFNKVFIYLGKFRSQISPSLVTKLFNFMRSAR